MSQMNGLADALWAAKRDATVVEAVPELDATQATDVLKTLVQRSVSEGDDIVGWKVGGSDQTLAFVAPVFNSSFRPLRMASLCSPRYELEFVGRIASTAHGVEFDPAGWTLGFEIVDSHSVWKGSAAWLMADWGMHAAAVIGDESDFPIKAEQTSVRVTTPQDVQDIPANVGVNLERVTRLLSQYCAVVGRDCMKDDLVFTGSVFGSHSIPTLGDYIATIDRYGTVTARLAA